jgi:hypothetical protein
MSVTGQVPTPNTRASALSSCPMSSNTGNDDYFTVKLEHKTLVNSIPYTL